MDKETIAKVQQGFSIAQACLYLGFQLFGLIKEAIHDSREGELKGTPLGQVPGFDRMMEKVRREPDLTDVDFGLLDLRFDQAEKDAEKKGG